MSPVGPDLDLFMPPTFDVLQETGSQWVTWLRDNLHCLVECKWLEHRDCSGLHVRPWQQQIITLARKVHQMGWFFSFSPQDSTQLHFLSLPGEKTGGEREAERGTVGGSWTGQGSNTREFVWFLGERISFNFFEHSACCSCSYKSSTYIVGKIWLTSCLEQHGPPCYKKKHLNVVV